MYRFSGLFTHRNEDLPPCLCPPPQQLSSGPGWGPAGRDEWETEALSSNPHSGQPWAPHPALLPHLNLSFPVPGPPASCPKSTLCLEQQPMMGLLITGCLRCSSLSSSCVGLSALPGLGWLLSQVREVFSYYLFKYFLRPFLLLEPPWVLVPPDVVLAIA